MRRVLVGGLLLAGLVWSAADVRAQGIIPIAAGVQGGAAFPVGDFGSGDQFNTGWGFEASARVRVAPMLAVYAAYDRFTFESSDEGTAGAFGEGELVDAGFAAGAHLSLPLVAFGPWVRAGAIFNQASFDAENEVNEFESERSLGFEAGAGVSIPLGLVVSITPAVRYRTYAPEFEEVATPAGLERLSYITAEFGMTFQF